VTAWRVDDVLCEVETDKTNLEIPSPAAGVLLAQAFPSRRRRAGDGDHRVGWRRLGEQLPIVDGQLSIVDEASAPADLPLQAAGADEAVAPRPAPRWRRSRSTCRHLAAGAPSGGAQGRGRDAGLSGSGPGGRVIERDVEAALAAQPKLTPVAKAMVAEGGFAVPAQGSGPSGRITSKDLVKEQARQPPARPNLQSPISQSPSRPVLPPTSRSSP
jgi:pyruvate dehydrogenase E2 component (dihydrolipoamide acetyltransferase)